MVQLYPGWRMRIYHNVTPSEVQVRQNMTQIRLQLEHDVISSALQLQHYVHSLERGQDSVLYNIMYITWTDVKIMYTSMYIT
jgi:hypothetical protein